VPGILLLKSVADLARGIATYGAWLLRISWHSGIRTSRDFINFLCAFFLIYHLLGLPAKTFDELV